MRASWSMKNDEEKKIPSSHCRLLSSLSLFHKTKNSLIQWNTKERDNYYNKTKQRNRIGNKGILIHGERRRTKNTTLQPLQPTIVLRSLGVGKGTSRNIPKTITSHKQCKTISLHENFSTSPLKSFFKKCVHSPFFFLTKALHCFLLQWFCSYCFLKKGFYFYFVVETCKKEFYF